MRQPVRLQLLRRLIESSADPSRELTPSCTRISSDRYTDPDQLEGELEALFRQRPVIMAHVSELAEPGSFVTADIAGVPLIAARDAAGEIHVFVNACRHRSARLVDAESGCGKKALVCPYHAWSYRLDGSLLHIPQEHAFAQLERSELGLSRVFHSVRHGFIWIGLAGERDVADYLGPVIDDDLEAFGLAGYRVARKTARVVAANWKLVIDAFAEGYHVKALHRETLARFFIDPGLVDDCAPHCRQVGARKGLLEAAEQPAETWDFHRLATLFYNVFPNSVFVFHPNWVTQLSALPEGVASVRVVHRMLVPGAPMDDDERARIDKSFAHIDELVFENEDLAIAQSIQSTLRAGAARDIVLGGLEEGMRLFHLARDRALESSDT